jgi:hypothetical protein
MKAIGLCLAPFTNGWDLFFKPEEDTITGTFHNVPLTKYARFKSKVGYPEPVTLKKLYGEYMRFFNAHLIHSPTTMTMRCRGCDKSYHSDIVRDHPEFFPNDWMIGLPCCPECFEFCRANDVPDELINQWINEERTGVEAETSPSPDA